MGVHFNSIINAIRGSSVGEFCSDHVIKHCKEACTSIKDFLESIYSEMTKTCGCLRKVESPTSTVQGQTRSEATNSSDTKKYLPLSSDKMSALAVTKEKTIQRQFELIQQAYKELYNKFEKGGFNEDSNKVYFEKLKTYVNIVKNYGKEDQISLAEKDLEIFNEWMQCEKRNNTSKENNVDSKPSSAVNTLEKSAIPDSV